MERKLILKMVQNCLKQYQEESISISLNSEEFEEIYNKIMNAIEKEKEDNLHEVINDAVYGYITDSPYF